jgi:hypothetical protein
MGSRLVLAMVAAVAIVAVGGIGFAAWTSSVTVSGSGTAGAVTLTWCSANGVPTGACTASPSFTGTGGCSISASGSVLTLSGDNLGPSESCDFTAAILDTGSLPATVTESGTNGYAINNPSETASGGGFSYGGITYTDDGYSNEPIASGGTLSYSATLSATASGGTVTFTITLTGTAA